MKPTRFFLTVLFALVLPYFNYSQAAENNIQFRGNLDNSRIQFLKNKKGNVAFMGGSITEMNGYRPMVADQLKKREEMLAARESEVAVLRSQLDSQLLSLDSHIRSKEADVIRKHEELMQVRDSLNHKIST